MASETVVSTEHINEIHSPPDRVSIGSHINSMSVYKKIYDQSIQDPNKFWSDRGSSMLDWIQPFHTVHTGDFSAGDSSWFIGGKLNVSYNCIDRHIANGLGNKIAIIWEPDEPTQSAKHITYIQLQQEVCKLANAMKRAGVRKGDCVCIYMPMIPEAAYAMLACARLGAPHNVVFAGFSSESLRDRIVDAQCQFVITADEGRRGGRGIPLKSLTDHALARLPPGFIKRVFVYQRSQIQVNMVEGRDVWYHDAVNAERGYCPCEVVDSEDSLFMLYTSGSTGKPKGILHTQAGYLLYTMMTTKYVFDLRPDDIHACVADVGWITGHSYIIYGPLANGATTLMFESTPLYPDASRYWQLVEKHKITSFYTAPTAIRSLMKFGNDIVTKHDRSSIRILGTVGEPINPEAWRWYYNVVGNQQCSVVDTYWQTETGGHMLTPLPGATPQKPGSATLPFFGVAVEILDTDGNVQSGNNVSGVLAISRPWPGMARTIFGDHSRYLQTYMATYKGYYFTGDGALRDKDGYYWITGRVDDVINSSGHRIGTAEIESALVLNSKVAEAAVVGIPHDVKGQALFCYVIAKNGITSTPEVVKELKQSVRDAVGSFATPDYLLIIPALPKTRSGKIMRRLLRKIACGDTENLGDTSTLAEPEVVTSLIDAANTLRNQGVQK